MVVTVQINYTVVPVIDGRGIEYFPLQWRVAINHSLLVCLIIKYVTLKQPNFTFKVTITFSRQYKFLIIKFLIVTS